MFHKSFPKLIDVMGILCYNKPNLLSQNDRKGILL